MSSLVIELTVDDLDPFGTETCDKVKYYLGLKGWHENFYDVDSDVGHEDFDALVYDRDVGLDTADFHWHFGHGYNLLTHAIIALWDYHPVYNGWARIDHWDVYKRWDADNEWVVLQSCHVLNDLQWGHALKYSHMILGYKTITYADPKIADYFFAYALGDDETVVNSWYYATKATYSSDVQARVMADTLDQFYNDHLHEEGYVAPDEYPDDGTFYYSTWTC